MQYSQFSFHSIDHDLFSACVFFFSWKKKGRKNERVCFCCCCVLPDACLLACESYTQSNHIIVSIAFEITPNVRTRYNNIVCTRFLLIFISMTPLFSPNDSTTMCASRVFFLLLWISMVNGGSGEDVVLVSLDFTVSSHRTLVHSCVSCFFFFAGHWHHRWAIDIAPITHSTLFARFSF